ncbi:hypothetical protein T484DRAFT_2517935 [Baffinella frigidus]|nr:hypothetical protein T484DRAFT_2517935 [Cryptophyta sp. CCMP2293]
MSEQGWVNVLYKTKWENIGFVHNANLAAYVQDRQLWDRLEEHIAIIHFTMNKPWACTEEYAAICRVWHDLHV